VAGSAWPNVYEGINGTFTTTDDFDDLVANVTADHAALFIQNSNGDEALDSSEKGFLVISLGTSANARDHIVVEIKPEKAAPLTVDFYVPESLPEGWISVAG
jgi:archaellin